MENSVITEIAPTGFGGKFNYEGATGTFTTDGQKSLREISGSKEGYGSFDANTWTNPEGQWTYNPHFTDPTKAADLIEIMMDSIEAVEEDLSQE